MNFGIPPPKKDQICSTVSPDPVPCMTSPFVDVGRLDSHGIAVNEATPQHIGDRLEAPVGMGWETLGQQKAEPGHWHWRFNETNINKS